MQTSESGGGQTPSPLPCGTKLTGRRGEKREREGGFGRSNEDEHTSFGIGGHEKVSIANQSPAGAYTIASTCVTGLLKITPPPLGLLIGRLSSLFPVIHSAIVRHSQGRRASWFSSLASSSEAPASSWSPSSSPCSSFRPLS